MRRQVDGVYSLTGRLPYTPYSIDLWHEREHRKQLGLLTDLPLARLAFAEAMRLHPDLHVTLRQAAHVLADSRRR